ncbi:MAG: tetratricopeptide repeat protein [Pirellulaceae bacterium]|nr:tetratricopeptide repeat protein [Pirellulaceae bacterium]
MLAPDRISCFWPGLAQAWWRGSLTGLVAAISFGWGLCVLMLATFVWPNWFWSWLTTLCWVAMLVFWLIECVRSHWQLGKLNADAGPVAGDDRFARAQAEYLRGNWFEAESLLHAVLSDTPRDAEAHLLLAGVLRHSGRLAAALRRLDQMELLDTAARWSFEIRRERHLLLKRQSATAESTASAADAQPAEGPAMDGEDSVVVGQMSVEAA